MLKKIIIGLIVVLLIAAGCGYYFLSSMGYFMQVKVMESDMGPLTIVYTHHIGDYSKIAPDMMGVYNRLESEFNIKPLRAIGIFYDNPQTVKTAQLRSDVGFLLDPSDSSSADKIMKKMKVMIKYKKPYVTATFPLKNDMSYVLGVIKVYPEMMKYMSSHGDKMGPSIEIYDRAAKKIIYAFEAKK
jgi:hypothetical protein